MLYSQRVAYAKMLAPRRVIHLLLWHVYRPLAGVAVARRLWGLYRRTWPR
jgi:hypothetical protein